MKEHATNSCSSETECQGHCSCKTNDPVKHIMEVWRKAFHEAFYQAQVERLRKRIESNLGPMLDKAADATFETASKIFQSQASEFETKKEFESKLQKLLSEIGKR